MKLQFDSSCSSQYIRDGKKVFKVSLLDCKKVKLKEVYGHFRLSNFTPDYNTNKLKKDIETNGLKNDIIVFKIVAITNNNQHEPFIETWPNVKYQLWDGNHRCSVLRELYGDNHEININIDKKPFILNNNNFENQLLQYNLRSLASQKKHKKIKMPSKL